MKNNSGIILAKYGEESNLKSMQKNGLLYMNTISFFKKCEKDEMGDPNEAIDRLMQNPIVTITAEINGVKKIITDEVISARFDYEEKEYTHIFCLGCICDGDQIRDDHKIFDDRLGKFGDSILIVFNPTEFMIRLVVALDKEIKDNNISNYKADTVEYIDPKIYNGEVGVFKKFNRFSHQQEWRLAVQNLSHQSEPYKLIMNSIEDISILLHKSDFKNKIQIENSRIKMIL